ncbi:endolytic transglycosylase MltG [Desulfosarcina sp. OttesenSCG-928-A07]|nr:endolytic transglycosylase MltG [Desulfosarcina sp. OttesenSCG-928-G17]MDL2329711.1 endolytic transglycosylase MltG [Desulfosarcina sp. OttesenSCG-928-A07]
MLMFFLFVLTAVVGIGGAYLNLMVWADLPLTPGAGKDKVFTLFPGQGPKQAALSLEKEKLVSNAFRFVLLARIEGKDKKLKAGDYLLSTAMSPRKILDNMAKGRVYLHRVTIPEGYTLVQIADVVAAAGLSDAVQFLNTARDPEVVQKMGIVAETLEGYLFPDTYYFPRGLDPADILFTMVKRFRAAFTPEREARAKELGMTLHEVVTLASIVEKETGVPEERALVSSVFHNRLKKGMRLETDPTVIYGIPNFDGDIRRHHLTTYTPYNTYKITGLPPGPIASPGTLAIHATLYPAETDFLYFVAKGNGTHYFSHTYAEHNRAVIRYQLKNTSR